MTIVILMLNLVKKSDEEETTPNLIFHFPIWPAINNSSRQILAGTEWNLQVTNIANTSVSYGYNQLLAMPKTTVSANLFCYGDLFTIGDWVGVSLSYILQQVGLDPAIDSLSVFLAQDGYTVSPPLKEAIGCNRSLPAKWRISA